MAKRIHLLIIDPQIDFCDPNGALYVHGADADMKRLSGFIRRMIGRLTSIQVTLDSHHLVDVAHPPFWRTADGEHPEPFTVVQVSDVTSGRLNPTQYQMRSRMIDYVKTLERNGRYQLCIWPPHCLIGSTGAAVYPEVLDALGAWETTWVKPVDFSMKGTNIYTEHYSAIQAEVPDSADMSTVSNMRIINAVKNSDEVLVAGEAGSHCLANTVRDLTRYIDVDKLVLLEDATSPVQGFEDLYTAFRDEMAAKGMRVSTTTDYE